MFCAAVLATAASLNNVVYQFEHYTATYTAATAAFEATMTTVAYTTGATTVDKFIVQPLLFYY